MTVSKHLNPPLKYSDDCFEHLVGLFLYACDRKSSWEGENCMDIFHKKVAPKLKWIRGQEQRMQHTDNNLSYVLPRYDT